MLNVVKFLYIILQWWYHRLCNTWVKIKRIYRRIVLLLMDSNVWVRGLWFIWTATGSSTSKLVSLSNELSILYATKNFWGMKKPKILKTSFVKVSTCMAKNHPKTATILMENIRYEMLQWRQWCHNI